MNKPTIEIYNQVIKVDIQDTPVLKEVLRDICRYHTTFEVFRVGKAKKLIAKVSNRYYYLSKDGNSARFSINAVRKVIEVFTLRGFPREYIDIVDNREYSTNYLKVTMNENITPRAYQHKYIKAISGDNAKRAHLVDLPPGKGKSLIGSYAVAKNKMITAVLTKSGYLEKWINDINKYMVLEDNDVYLIQGSESIAKLIDMDQSERDVIKFYIMSMRTMQNYVESYIEDRNSVPIAPYKLLRFLKVGTILNDESHQEFASLFKIILFLDPKRLIGLSATMESDDAKTNYMYRLLYPPEDRASNLVKYDKYIYVRTFSYKLATFRMKYKTPMGYNHIMFEQSIMKFPKALQDYMEMVKYYIDEEYIKHKTTGDKCLIFFATIDMCTLFTSYIARKYTDLDIRKFTQGDPYENVLEADICISTNKSAGTAVDIPGLITAIQTVSISGTQPNIQAPGRLRDLDGKTMRYICLYSSDLSVHRKMDMRRRKALESIYKSYSSDSYSKTIGDPYN